MTRLAKFALAFFALFVLAFAVLCSDSRADDTGFKSPALSSDGTWTNPNNAFSSNDAYAAQDATNAFQAWKNFTFNVPAGATSFFIEVTVEGLGSPECGSSVEMTLSWNDGTSFTAAKTGTLPGVEGTITFGGSADNWGRTWLEGDFTNANFRARIKGTTDPLTCEAQADHVQVKIYYTPASTGDARRRRLLLEKELEERDEKEFCRKSPTFIFRADSSAFVE